MAEPKKYIRGRQGQQLDIGMTLGTVDDRRNFPVKALLDSGCTGSCISRRFCEENGINVHKFPLPIPVYNADGTENAGGAITDFVDLHVKIRDHTEKLRFAVTELGKSDVFIGHEWLKFHNPSIDWKAGTIEFMRCPLECTPLLRSDPESEDIDFEDFEDGDRILAVDIQEQIQIRAFQTASSRIAEKESKTKRPKTFEETVPRHYHDFKHVFSKESFDEMPPRRPWDHAIELVPGAEVLDCKIYPLNLEEQKQLDAFLDENLQSGRIRPSKSPMASPFFFIKKKDGTLRPVQDYRRLNDLTIKNRYPLPLIQELVDKLRKARYFTKLDVRWGFNNVRIQEGDEWKAAFRTNRGLFEPLVMFFGLTNSPATFQTMMNSIFKEEIDSGKVIIYMDDVLIYTETLEEHRKMVRQVLKKFADNKLFLKHEKCTFEADEVEYLGVLVSKDRVRMDPAKVSAVKDWPRPTSKKEVQQFLGFANFYRRFIEGYGKIAKPLTELTGKLDWKWGTSQEEAFDEIKRRMCNAPVLSLPNDNGKFRVETDSSDFATGAILSQEQLDGKWKPVAYSSHALNPTERNYEIYDKEMLAIMRALSEWRQYLLGAKEVFEIFTDHKNLEYFRKPQKLNRRQARWVSEMQDYNFTLHHKPGSQMTKADLLSRRAGHDKGEKDNEDVVLLKGELFRSVEITLEGSEKGFLERIKAAYKRRDRVVSKALLVHDKEWTINDQIVNWKNRVYVPKDPKLREDIIRAHHDAAVAGHPGRYKTQELITRNYWWPRINADVSRYVEGCQTCQRVKPRRMAIAAPLSPNEIPTRPWEIVSVDIIGPLPESNGFDAILVFVDRFSKKIEALPCNKEITSLGVAEMYRDHPFKHHGLPRKFISDRGPQFVSKFMTELCKLIGVDRNPSTAFHPQTDGQTERINQEIEQYLRIFVNHRQSDWAEWLPLAQFSYNDKIHSSTGFTPFFLNYGQHPYKGTEPRTKTNNRAAEEFAKNLRDTHAEAEAALKKAAEEMKRFYDRKRKDSVSYQVGDRVYLEGTNLTTSRPAKKLEDKRFGPFKILEKIGSSSYKLEVPRTWKTIHPVFNESLLTPYHEPAFPSQEIPPPLEPEIIEGEKAWEVESIEDSRIYRGKLQYFVNWKNSPKEERTWENAANVANSRELVEAFHQAHPNAVREVPAPRRSTRLRFIPIKTFTEINAPKLFNWDSGTFQETQHEGSRLRAQGAAEPMPKVKLKCRTGWCLKCQDVHEDVNPKGGVMSGNDHFSPSFLTSNPDRTLDPTISM